MTYNLILFAFFMGGFYSFSQSIQVKADHFDENSKMIDLEYGFGYPYDAKLPTIIVVVDAQQFYVRRDRIRKIQDELFGREFNVLGIVTRANNGELRKSCIKEDGSINWKRAYQLFNAAQFAHDIQEIVEQVLSNASSIHLYGQSGGAFLISEYLSLFPDTIVEKIFLAAAVNPVIEDYLGINHDKFYRDFLQDHPQRRMKLNSIFTGKTFDRQLISHMFQRQHFFESVELDGKRNELLNAFFEKDTAYVDSLKTSYQIDALNELFTSNSGIPIRVRLFEFIAPLADNIPEKEFYCPDLETSMAIAEPLLNLQEKEVVTYKPVFNKDSIKNFSGTVFILSGKQDHTVDYRSSIYLSGAFKNSTLFIANDDHVFSSLKENEMYSKLIQSFFNDESFFLPDGIEKHRFKEY